MELVYVNNKYNQYIFTDDEIQDIYDMYFNQDLSLQKIMDKYKISQSVLNRIFKEHNWELRKQTCHSRKYPLNEHYFDNINTPNKAYIMGLFYADGYNSGKSIKLCLQDRDIQILEDIKKELGTDIPLEKRIFTEHPTWHDAYTLNLNSVYMCKQLEKLGMVKAKSLILDFPNWITEDLFPFFLKGYIDGDGWVRPKTLGFMGTDKFSYGVQDYLKNHYNIKSSVMTMKRHYSEHTKTWYTSSFATSKQLSELMFSQSCLGIQRKVQKYIDYNYILFNANNSLSA